MGSRYIFSSPATQPLNHTAPNSNRVESKPSLNVLKGIAASIFSSFSAVFVESTFIKANIQIFQPRFIPSILKSGINYFNKGISTAKLGITSKNGNLGIVWSAFIEEIGFRFLFQAMFVRSLQKLYYRKFYPLHPEYIDSRYAQVTRILLSGVFFGLAHTVQECFEMPEFVKGDRMGTELKYGSYEWCICDIHQLERNSKVISTTITGIGFAIAQECAQKTKISVALPAVCHSANNFLSIYVFKHLDYFKNGCQYVCHPNSPFSQFFNAFQKAKNIVYL